MTEDIVTPEALLQVFYLTASVSILTVYLTPVLNKRFLAYGSRAVSDTSGEKDNSRSKPVVSPKVTLIDAVLDRIAAFKVPHNWFLHFYVVSIASSAFWAYQILSQGRIYSLLASFYPSSQDPGRCFRVVACCLLLVIQGMRRFYECLMQPHGSSEMWIGHYVVGVVFYLATGIAVWIEGLPDLKAHHAQEATAIHHVQSHRSSSTLQPDIIAYAVFGFASLMQSMIHAYLRSLRKYTLPSHYSFKWIVAPHYTCECAIYLSLAILSRPADHYLNRTMMAALIFVVVNLGISADGTKEWMRTKFGSQNVIDKWRMIPWMW